MVIIYQFDIHFSLPKDNELRNKLRAVAPCQKVRRQISKRPDSLFKKFLALAPKLGASYVHLHLTMRIIAVKTLKLYANKKVEAEQSLLIWYQNANKAAWKNHNELKDQIGNASMVGDKRVVFNIHGNKYRLIVDIEYRLQIIFIVWIGTHKEYDSIDAKTIRYGKAN